MKELRLKLTPKFDSAFENLVKKTGNKKQVLRQLNEEFGIFLKDFLENPLRKIGKIVYKNVPNCKVGFENILKFELLPFTEEKVSLIKPIWIKVEFCEGFILETENFSVFVNGETFEEGIENLVEELAFVFQSLKKERKLDSQNKKEFEKMKKVLKSETSELPKKSLDHEIAWEKSFSKSKIFLEEIASETLEELNEGVLEEIDWGNL